EIRIRGEPGIQVLLDGVADGGRRDELTGRQSNRRVRRRRLLIVGVRVTASVAILKRGGRRQRNQQPGRRCTGGEKGIQRSSRHGCVPPKIRFRRLSSRFRSSRRR